VPVKAAVKLPRPPADTSTVTLHARLPILVGAALAAALAGAFAIFLLAGGAGTERSASPAVQTPGRAFQPAEPEERVPRALTKALARHDVVVVAWFAPLDAAAMADARTGAQQAGAGFVRVNVMTEPTAVAFAEDHGGFESPAVLVFTRGPKLRSRIPGTPDRDVVAQAAANAG
jgi:hypothetical protein